MTGAEATLLAGIVAGVSAAAAAGFAALGTYQATERAARVQSQQEDRKRLCDAYIDLIWLAQMTMVQVESARSRTVVDVGADAAGVDYADEVRIRARVQALGSAAVRSRLLSWSTSLLYFRIALGQLNEIAGSPTSGRPPDFPMQNWRSIRADVENRRVALRSQTEALEALVRSELDLDNRPLAIPAI